MSAAGSSTARRLVLILPTQTGHILVVWFGCLPQRLLRLQCLVGLPCWSVVQGSSLRFTQPSGGLDAAHDFTPQSTPNRPVLALVGSGLRDCRSGLGYGVLGCDCGLGLLVVLSGSLVGSTASAVDRPMARMG